MAIIGLNSTCNCCGCKHDFDKQEVHDILREIVFRTHLTPKEYEIAQERINMPYNERPFHLIVINRKGIQYVPS
jgi:hypothetical protein